MAHHVELSAEHRAQVGVEGGQGLDLRLGEVLAVRHDLDADGVRVGDPVLPASVAAVPGAVAVQDVVVLPDVAVFIDEEVGAGSTVGRCEVYAVVLGRPLAAGVVLHEVDDGLQAARPLGPVVGAVVGVDLQCHATRPTCRRRRRARPRSLRSPRP